MSEMRLGTVTVTGYQGNNWDDWYWDAEYDDYHDYDDGDGSDGGDYDDGDFLTASELSNYQELIGSYIDAIEFILDVTNLSPVDKKAAEELLTAFKAIENTLIANDIVSSETIHDALSAGIEVFITTASDTFVETTMIGLGTLAAAALPEPTPVAELVGAVSGYVVAQGINAGFNPIIEAASDFLATILLEGAAGMLQLQNDLQAFIDQLPSGDAAEFLDYLIEEYPDNPLVEVFTSDQNDPADNGEDATQTAIQDLLSVISGYSYGDRGFRYDRVEPPLVVDLDGDGIELLSLSESQMRINLDEDDALERIAWASNDDGVVLYDYDSDGILSDISEVTFADLGGEGATDLEGFATLDADGDGFVTEGDFIGSDMSWDMLYVWQDVNGDGRSTTNEVFTFAELGITEISVTSDQQEEIVDGNIIHGRFDIIKEDGSSIEGGDVSFAGLSMASGGFDFGGDGQVVFNDLGNSLIFSSSNDDAFQDSAGDNAYIFDATDGSDVITEFSGSNTLVFDQANSIELFFGRVDDDLLITNLLSGSQVRIEDMFSGDAEITVITSDHVLDTTMVSNLVDGHSQFDEDSDGQIDDADFAALQTGELLVELHETWSDLA